MTHTHQGDFDSITKGLRTKSDKIRALARKGVSTADIARYLRIRYQHARNVLVASGLHPRHGEQRGATEQGIGGWIRIDALGRAQIPAALMKAAGIGGDEQVHIRMSEDGIEILSRRAALKRAHSIARQFVPEGVSLVDELIAERRREAAKNDE
jgi:hypothetical protein